MILIEHILKYWLIYLYSQYNIIIQHFSTGKRQYNLITINVSKI